MRSTIIVNLLFMLTAVSTNGAYKTNESEVTTLATELVNALRNNSQKDFLRLFPTLQKFKTIMSENRAVYGDNLDHAEREFIFEYRNHILPLVQKRFAELASSGVNWSAVSIKDIKFDDAQAHSSGARILITLTDGKIEHQLILDRALRFDGKWYISQFISFV